MWGRGAASWNSLLVMEALLFQAQRNLGGVGCCLAWGLFKQSWHLLGCHGPKVGAQAQSTVVPASCSPDIPLPKLAPLHMSALSHNFYKCILPTTVPGGLSTGPGSCSLTPKKQQQDVWQQQPPSCTMSRSISACLHGGTVLQPSS